MKIHCTYSELRAVGSLIHSPKNPKKHSAAQIKRLGKLLEFYGWRKPVVVSKQSGFIVTGHGKVMAAAKMGWKEVPVEYQDFESPDQELGYLVADNAIAEWDGCETDLAAVNTVMQDLDGMNFDLEMLGLEGFEVDAADKESDGTEDEVPEPPKEAKTKRGELWILGQHRLLIDDCTVKENVERLMAGEKADLLYTDPPYGDVKLLADNQIFRFSEGQNNLAHGTKYVKYGNEGTFQCDNLHNLVKDYATHLIIWGGNCFPLPVSTCWIVWDKSANEDATGNWFSDCELAWTNLKMPIVKIRHVLQGFVQETKEDRVHPTQKPVEMHKKCWARIEKSIKGNFSSRHVLDLFAGSGSTLIACEQTGRRFSGLEISEHYADVILARWAKYTGQDPVREDGTKWSELQ